MKIVDELLAERDRPMRVLDPFSGTGTTALCAAYRAHEGVTADINPFLVWLGEAKTAHYSDAAVAAARRACSHALDLVRRREIQPSPPPPIYNIERWWTPADLHFLRGLRSAIEAVTERDSEPRTLLLVSFCRTLIGLSNAAFNHQSMGFKDDSQLCLALDVDRGGTFSRDVEFVLLGAMDNPAGTARVLLGDSRDIGAVVGRHFDLIITSPPYANRMSYIRELRPYMYWLGFLANGRDAGELDWSAIGGTWGIATSRLSDWQGHGAGFSSGLLENAIRGIASHENKNGTLLSKYVSKYFDDMWKHFHGLVPVLAHDAELHYIVGNSTFYGVVLPVEQIYAAMLRALGFTNIECRPIRKRNSKKELIEFDVTAKWAG